MSETGAWPDPVERVAHVLREAAIDARVEQLQEHAATAKAAAQAVGCELPQIVKSLLVVCDGAAVIAFVPGDCRADLAAIGALVGAAEVRVARADEVVAATGFEPGGVAPFPHRAVARAVLDRSLLAQHRVWVGAGTAFHMAVLSPQDLQRLTSAGAGDIAVRG